MTMGQFTWVFGHSIVIIGPLPRMITCPTQHF